jgi:hypothetical protein
MREQLQQLPLLDKLDEDLGVLAAKQLPVDVVRC